MIYNLYIVRDTLYISVTDVFYQRYEAKGTAGFGGLHRHGAQKQKGRHENSSQSSQYNDHFVSVCKHILPK